MRKKIIFVILFLCFQLKLLAQQDAQFNQYLFNGMQINPGYTGYKEELYLQAFARLQMTGIKGAPQTLSISADNTYKEESLGVGILIDKDKIGAQNSLSAIGNLSYRIKLDRTETNVLAFGLGVGIKQVGLNGSLLDPKDLDDSRVPSGNVSQITPEFRAGVFYSNEKYFAGFSVTNLFSKSISLFSDYQLLNIKPQQHLYLTAGMALSLNDDVVFRPSFLLKDDLNGPTSLDLNAFFLFKERFWFGGMYRTSVKLYPKANLQSDLDRPAAAGFMMEYFTNNNFRIGYSYDFSLSKLGQYDYGSHEISVGYYFTTKKSRRPKCYF